MNLYGFVSNSSINRIDPLGLVAAYPTQFISPFTGHYYQGGGATFDLINEGMQDDLEFVLTKEIKEWEEKAKLSAKSKADEHCNGTDTGMPSFQIKDRSVIHPNLTLSRFFVLGKTTFTREFNLNVKADCAKCSFEFEGELRYSIEDKFADPIDISEWLGRAGRAAGNGNVFEGSIMYNILVNFPNVEIGGSPYNISGSWKNTPFKGSGQF